MNVLDPHFDNPAGRLWDFLRAMRSNPNTTEPLSSFLYSYFDLPSSTTGPLDPKLFAALQHLFGLPDQIEQAVRERQRQIPPADVLVRPLTNIRNALMQFVNLNIALNSVKAHFNDSDVSDLEHCSYYLDAEGSHTARVAADDLSTIRQLADELVESVLGSDDLDPTLKNFVWKHAVKIADAVRLARAAGAGVLESALNEAIGDLVRHPEIKNQVVKDQTLGKKFYGLLQAMSLVMGLVGTPLAITADGMDLLQVQDSPVVVVVEHDHHSDDILDEEPAETPK